MLSKSKFHLFFVFFLLNTTIVFSQITKGSKNKDLELTQKEFEKEASDFLKRHNYNFRELDSTASFNKIKFGEDFKLLNKYLEIKQLKDVIGAKNTQSGLIGNKDILKTDSLDFIGFASFLNQRLISLTLESFSDYKVATKYFISKYGIPHYFNDDNVIWEGYNLKITVSDGSKVNTQNSLFGGALVSVILLHNDAVDTVGENLFLNAVINKKNKNIESSLSLIDKYISFYPNSTKAYIFRGTIQKNENKAIDDFSKAIELNNKIGYAYLMRGLNYEVLGMKTKACEDFKKASQLGDKDAKKFLVEYKCPIK